MLLLFALKIAIIRRYTYTKGKLMIISFCGHSCFRQSEKYKKTLFDFFEKVIGEKTVSFYLGGYGGFDDFAYSCAKEFKEKHQGASLVFVSPYLTLSYQKNHLAYKKEKYDSILYPEIEDKPLKFAISYRNKYMVEAADIVVAFVNQKYGGAYQTYQHAKRKGKTIFNLAEQTNV